MSNPFGPMTKILDRLYLGNLQNARGLAEANPYGVRFVFNCTPDRLEPIHNVRISQWNLNDGVPIPYDTTLSMVHSILQQVELGPVLVCCHTGISRSPGIVAAYLTRIGMCWDDAVDFIGRRRPVVRLHHLISLSIRQALGIAPRPEEGSL